jgi:NhaA family Na+:H+ antiporter
VTRSRTPFPIPQTVRRARAVAEALRTEATGGAIMLAAAAIALIWANTPLSGAYEAMRNIVVGPAALHLDLSLEQWASDGLLTVFFLVAGVELKREFVSGELRSPRKAALPIIAAFAGMVVPALLYTVVSWGAPDASRGWAVPMATDIALALAVLAVTASALPTALRAFLLTLAVVDDLGAIAVIAVFYTDHISYVWLGVTIVLLAGFGLLQWRGVRTPWVYVPLGVVIWAAMHASGVHATVAGVAMGLLIRSSTADRAEHLLRPVSAGVAVPVFALMSAGVSLAPSALAGVFADRIALGVIVGLVAGKVVGVFGGARLAVALGLARISDDLHWRDIAAVSLLAGVGFTVSLLIGDLAYDGTPHLERVTTAVLIATVIAGVLSAILLRIRVRRRRAAPG